MGAHNFEDGAYAETAEEAFRLCTDDALYQYGHDAYNGTISTNDGFIEIPLNEGETIHEWHNRILEDDRVQKWGPCACVKDPKLENDGKPLWHFGGWASC